jgi:hypothetical protein
MMNHDDLPGVAEVAIQSGLHVARANKERVKSGDRAVPFKYRGIRGHGGSMAAAILGLRSWMPTRKAPLFLPSWGTARGLGTDGLSTRNMRNKYCTQYRLSPGRQ